MQEETATHGSSLTLFNPSDSTILGELFDAQWTEEKSTQGSNYLLSGLASDGTLDTLETFIDQGMDTVKFIYSNGDAAYEGEAFLLRPAKVRESSGTNVRIETPTKPVRISR